MNVVYIVLGGRRLCITARGYIGLVPRNTSLRTTSSSFPGLLFPWYFDVEGEKYVFVRKFYVRDIMDREH
jgi:hypothetical protein